MSKSCRPNFTVVEDRHLCSVFLHISQEGVFQSRDLFWKRMIEKYHFEKPSSNISDRSQRSLQCRMETILKDARKFNGCLQQIEHPNPDGANEQLIVSSYLYTCSILFFSFFNLIFNIYFFLFFLYILCS